MQLFCDSNATISIAYDPVQHDRTKHIKVERHFIREKLQTTQMWIPFVKNED